MSMRILQTLSLRLGWASGRELPWLSEWTEDFDNNQRCSQAPPAPGRPRSSADKFQDESTVNDQFLRPLSETKLWLLDRGAAERQGVRHCLPRRESILSHHVLPGDLSFPSFYCLRTGGAVPKKPCLLTQCFQNTLFLWRRGCFYSQMETLTLVMKCEGLCTLTAILWPLKAVVWIWGAGGGETHMSHRIKWW